MPKYEDYPFYEVLIGEVTEIRNRVIRSVNDKVGNVDNYDDALNILTHNYPEYSFETFKDAVVARNTQHYIDRFEDNVDIINSYIKKWEQYITKIRVSPVGCSTFVVIDNKAFVDNGILNYSKQMFEYDTLSFHTNGMLDKVKYDPEEMQSLISLRFGETDSVFKQSGNSLFCMMLKKGGLDLGFVDQYETDNVITTESGDVDIVVNANKPEEEYKEF